MATTTHHEATAPRLRIRTLTAGITVRDAADGKPIDDALAFLANAKQRAADAGYEIQTIRVALNPILCDVPSHERHNVLPALIDLDRRVAAAGAIVSIGPVMAS